MKKTRMLAIHFRTPPLPESLPEFASMLLQFSPRVGIRPPDTIYIDITSTIRFFGGELAIVQRVKEFFAQKQISARIALADDLATAGLLARTSSSSPVVVPRGESERALAPLPVSHLLFLANPLSPPISTESRSAEHTTEVLSLLGIRVLGGFARLPASTIGNRFGSLGVELHRRARGASSLPLRPFEPSVTYREQRSFEHPTALLEPLLFAAKGLLEKLEKRLAQQLHSALEVNVYLESEMCEETEISIPLIRPLRRSKSLLGVVKERLSRVTLTAPIISIAIELSIPVRSRGSQFHLFDTHEQQSEKLGELLGRLVAGLGPTFVSAAALRERYRPEASWGHVPFSPTPVLKGARLLSGHSRPTLLVDPPVPFEEKHDVISLSGPERLNNEWWEKEPLARDYFVAQTRSGQQLWLFKNAKQKFFLHGYFD